MKSHLIHRKRWTRAVSVLTAALVVSLPAGSTAQAGTRVIIKGGGWGHGIGMSQYGAYGRALNGVGAERILKHYYTGVNIRRGRTGSVRVGLLQSQTTIGLQSLSSGRTGGRVVFKLKGRRDIIARGDADVSWQIVPTGRGGMKLLRNGNPVRYRGSRVISSGRRPVLVKYVKFDTTVRVIDKGLNYREGKMELSDYGSSACAGGRCLRLVLSIAMQKYLLGIAEMPSSWPLEALQAQVIASRTYVTRQIRTLGQHRSPCGCGVYDTAIDQVYRGDAHRTESGSYWERWVRAVRSTKKQLIMHNGEPILALYSSSSGGHTEHNENVWGGTPLPYLRGVPDRPDSVSSNPNHKWRVTMSRRSFSKKLDAAYGTGRFRRIRFVPPRGVSGRVTVVKSDGTGGARIVGRQRTVRVSGASLKTALGLRDTLFWINFRR